MRPITLAACLLVSLAKAQSPLTNTDVIRMVAYGISPIVVKATINKCKAGFDLSPDGLIQLKKSGLSDDILMVMISKTNAAVGAPARDSLNFLSTGIYYKTPDRYISFEPGYLASASSKGFGRSLKKSFSDFIAFKIKASMEKAHSSTQIQDPRPTFLFALDYPARNPEEFFLVRLRSTDSTRQIIYEKPTGGAGLIVINDSLKVDFNTRKLENNFFEVSPAHSLPPGEYGFIYSGVSFYSRARYTIYDFRIGEK
jgi:hypothetical protein